MIEAFWSRMHVELLDTQNWDTRIELANAMFSDLEIWHNRRRRHGQLLRAHHPARYSGRLVAE